MEKAILCGTTMRLCSFFFNGSTNGGINDLDGRPSRVNLKLRRGLHDGVSLSYYDGTVQHGFRYPRAAWRELYCHNETNKNICELEKSFSNDYEEEIFEYHVDSGAGGASGIVAKRNIKQGTISG